MEEFLKWVPKFYRHEEREERGRTKNNADVREGMRLDPEC